VLSLRTAAADPSAHLPTIGTTSSRSGTVACQSAQQTHHRRMRCGVLARTAHATATGKVDVSCSAQSAFAACSDRRAHRSCRRGVLGLTGGGRFGRDCFISGCTSNRRGQNRSYHSPLHGAARNAQVLSAHSGNSALARRLRAHEMQSEVAARKWADGREVVGRTETCSSRPSAIDRQSHRLLPWRCMPQTLDAMRGLVCWADRACLS
jgi:hypothetical protein